MKHRITFILLLLVATLGGAIVNVAVAWMFAMQWPVAVSRHFGEIFIRVGDRADTRVDATLGLIRLHQTGPALTPDWSRFGKYMIDEGRYASIVPKWSAFHGQEPGYDEPLSASDVGWQRMRFAECGAGWPAFALRGTCSWLIDQSTTKTVVRSHGLVHVTEARHLPLLPIWPGFAINMVFYAAILWGLFAAPFALRRRRRIKRGLCPKCAYPVGTNAVCTECGAALPSPSR